MSASDDLDKIWVPDRRRNDSPQGPGPAPRALAVDDDESYLRLLSALLTDAGFEVTCASEGLSALQRMAEQSYDLVLLDLKMPGLDGFETFEGSTAARENTYFILLTSNDALDVRLQAFERGFNDFISKNANYLELAAKLKSARKTVLLQRQLREEITELKRVAMTDQLTGLTNRLFFITRAREFSSLGVPLHLVLFDLDDFKSVNDRFGHLVGDRVLADIGFSFRNVTRTTDVVSRYGGDEFVMLLVGIDEATAEAVAQRVTREIAKRKWSAAGDNFGISCSYGIASSEGRQKTLPELLEEADAALYSRKRSSNRIQ